MSLSIEKNVYLGQAKPGGSAVIAELNVTPTTSAQTITAPEGTDGYSPVKVSAVTSSIDANIQAGNIKKDVTILGVTGTYAPTGTINITTKPQQIGEFDQEILNVNFRWYCSQLFKPTGPDDPTPTLFIPIVDCFDLIPFNYVRNLDFEYTLSEDAKNKYKGLQ